MIGRKIEIQTLGWEGDQASEAGMTPTASLYTRVLIDGEELQGVISATIKTHNGFNTILLEMNTGNLTLRTLTGQEWGGIRFGEHAVENGEGVTYAAKNE